MSKSVQAEIHCVYLDFFVTGAVGKHLDESGVTVYIV